MCSRFASFRIFSWSFAMESRWYISPVAGDGNMYWLSGCLLCSWIRRSTASCGMETLRTEVSVLGRERVNSPLGFRTYCLPMKMVLFLVSRSSQRRAAQRDVVSWVPTATNAGTDFYLVAAVGFGSVISLCRNGGAHGYTWHRRVPPLSGTSAPPS